MNEYTLQVPGIRNQLYIVGAGYFYLVSDFRGTAPKDAPRPLIIELREVDVCARTWEFGLLLGELPATLSREGNLVKVGALVDYQLLP
jgi:hypothetical protein